MALFHRLDAEADRVFLDEALVDPLTRVAFRPTNHVVRCRTCGLVVLRETWEGVGGCPNGHATPDRWDPRQAAQGDGQLGAVPVATPVAAAAPAPAVAAAPAARRPAWLLPAAVLGLAALVAVGIALSRDREDAPPPPAPVEAGPTAPTAIAATAGETAGTLGEGDFRTAEGFFQDLYTFEADSSGRLLTFTLASSAFPPDLVVTTPEGDRVEAEQLSAVVDEDAPTTTVVRRLRVADLRGPGTYRVLVSSRQPLATGAYTLDIAQAQPVQTLTAGAPAFAAELGKGVRVDGSFQDAYSFRGVEGREHTLTVVSSAFAPSVSFDGGLRAETGRGGDRVTYTFTPTRTGSYRAIVTSRDRGKTGAYTVRLEVAPAPPEPAAERPPAPSAAGVLRAGGAPVRDSLAAGQSRAYTLRGRIGDRVVIEARADGFTPTLVLIGPDGSRESGPGDGDRARVRATLPTEGTYRLILGGSAAGAFSLSLEQRAAPTSDNIPRMPGQDLPPRPEPPAPAPPPQDQNDPPQPVGDGLPDNAPRP